MEGSMTALRWFCQAIAVSVVMAFALTMMFGELIWTIRIKW